MWTFQSAGCSPSQAKEEVRQLLGRDQTRIRTGKSDPSVIELS